MRKRGSRHSPMRRSGGRDKTHFLEIKRNQHLCRRPQVAIVDRIKRAPEDADHNARYEVQEPRCKFADRLFNPTRTIYFIASILLLVSYVYFCLLSDMAIAEHNEFLRRQALQSHGTTGMQLVSAYADLCAEPVLESVGETSRSIDHD